MGYQPQTQFAEDAAHTSGDKGLEVLAVRNDTRGVLSDTNGDYTPLQTNSLGDLRVDGSAVTQPVSASSLPLPTGAATSAKQPALGTAGSASADVLTVQGVTSMTPLKVDGSGVTQPVSGTVTASSTTGSVADQSADSGNPVKVGGKYNLTQPTYTDGNRGDLQIDARGNLRVILGTSGTPITAIADNTDAAGASATANKLGVLARTTVYNGTSWDRKYNNLNTTTGDTGAKTTTFNGATQTNFNFRGATILFNMGTVSGTTPTLVAKIQGSADSGTTWYDIPGASTPSITATGTTVLCVYPGATVAANAAVSYPLPRTWRVVYTIAGTTPSFTITNVQVSYIL